MVLALTPQAHPGRGDAGSGVRAQRIRVRCSGGDGVARRLGEPSGGSDRRCGGVGPPSGRLSVPAGLAGDRCRPARRRRAWRRRPHAAQPRGAARRRPADPGVQGRCVGGGAAAGGTGAGGVVLVNINTADEPTLETLNGVGPALAAAIIQYRTDQGPFTSVDQLDEVSGIGPATLEKLRPQVTV
ncbi:MAG: ComEA family DNA-binding protein [Actinobacteria bacterium]|nr:MAG: ComEA family DNA-binding protein [Actinomycetota bacterium]